MTEPARPLLSRLVAACAVVGLLLSATPVAAADKPDEQTFFSSRAPGPDYIGYASSNQFELRMATSAYEQVSYQNIPNAMQLRAINFVHECGKTASKCVPETDVPNQNLYSWYVALLPNCTNPSQQDCIFSVSATDESGKVLPGTILDSFHTYNPQSFTGNSTVHLPSGGSSFLVDIPGAPHAGGSKYLIVAELDGDRDPGKLLFNNPSMQLGIFAVSLVNGSYQPNTTPTDLTPPPGGPNGMAPHSRNHPHLETCIGQSQTQCAIPWPLPLDLKFSVGMRLSQPLNGWFHGRVSDASVDVKSVGNNTEYMITAKPVIVPMVGKYSKISELPANLYDYYAKQPTPIGGTGKCQQFDNEVSCLRQQTDFSQRGMEEFLLWLSFMKDTAISAPTMWALRTVRDGQDINQSCYTNSADITGIVMTNATNYLSGPPVFDKENGTLDYKVAAPHFLPSGKEFQGTYDLIINSKTARCLYGFSDAPVQATVSVVSADGTQQTTTTVVREANGWLYLAAKGFTFSSPTLRITMKQAPLKGESATPVEVPQAPVVAPAPIPVAAATPATKIATKPVIKTVTCVKGKVSKKVTGSSCPVGYKKK